MKLLFFILTFALLTGCADSNSDVPATNTEVTAPKPDSTLAPNAAVLTLEKFESIPDSIDGCGDYYAVDTAKAEKGSYVFLSNMTEFGYIRIHGKTIKLQKNQALSKEVSPDHFISVFEGNGYKATLEAKIHEQYDEGGFYKGKLQIERDNEKLIINVHGETGC